MQAHTDVVERRRQAPLAQAHLARDLDGLCRILDIAMRAMGEQHLGGNGAQRPIQRAALPRVVVEPIRNGAADAVELLQLAGRHRLRGQRHQDRRRLEVATRVRIRRPAHAVDFLDARV